MTPITDSEIKQKGLGALIAALGEVDAERFITLVNREPFDYTKWQRNLFTGLDVKELACNEAKERTIQQPKIRCSLSRLARRLAEKRAR